MFIKEINDEECDARMLNIVAIAGKPFFNPRKLDYFCIAKNSD
jgi:hypothetical protein